MELMSVVERVASFDAACRDRDEILAAAKDVARVRRWLDARDIVVTRALAAVSSYPEKALADATGVPTRRATRATERAEVAAAAPAFADALDAGAIEAEHLDAFRRGLRGLAPTERQTLLDDAERLVDIAACLDADEFGKRVKAAADRLRAERGMETLERQRRDTRLRSWLDDRGMWRLSGAFDPETGMKLAARLKAAKEALFREAQPATCPDDAIERDQHLYAHALVALVLPAATRTTLPAASRPEFVAVIDGSQPPGPDGPAVDWGLPVELPAEILANLVPTADVRGIVLWNGLVLHAPGTLDLGRSTRIANRAQRRVLRGWYASCAVPGCATRFDDCRMHHVTWWRHGGPTDLANLLPVCTHHHTKIHDGGWQVTLGADRSLRIRLPDGQVLSTGPPGRGRRAA